MPDEAQEVGGGQIDAGLVVHSDERQGHARGEGQRDRRRRRKEITMKRSLVEE